MYTILLLIICVEVIVLAVLSALKKLTRGQFFLIAGVTLLCCAVLLVIPRFGKKSELEEAEEKDYIYMAATLLNENAPDEAAQALERVGDAGNEAYGIGALRALTYNMAGQYQAARLYLDEPQDEAETDLKAVSELETAAPEALKENITGKTLRLLDISESDRERLNVEMKIRFLGGEGESHSDIWFTIRELVGSNRLDEAYNEALKTADAGSVEGAILTAEMYARNLGFKFTVGDTEYSTILDRAAEAEVSASRALIRLEQDGDTLTEDDRRELADVYSSSLTTLNIALDNLDMEARKRAIRLLENLEADEKYETAINLELAKLCYLCGLEEDGDAHLDRVFSASGSSPDKRLGTDVALLKKVYLDSVITGISGDFSGIFGNMMNSLYMGVWEQDNNKAFEQQLYNYLHRLTGGIRVNTVDAGNYPNVEFFLAVSDRDRAITADTLWVEDEGSTVQINDIEKVDDAAMNVCYVLDISGSMMGARFESVVNAVCTNVHELGDKVKAGLVTFSNGAKVETPLSSKYQVEMTARGLACTSGGTNISAGLSKAADVLESSYGERIVFLLSDGYDQYPGNLPAALDKLESEGAVVYVIGLEGCDEQYLISIADRMGGVFMMASDNAQIADTYSELSKYLANIFRITYTATDEAAAEGRHILRVGIVDTPIETGRIYSDESEAQGEDVGVLTGYAGLFAQVKG